MSTFFADATACYLPPMSSELDNRMTWDRRPGHYEVWYATLSHRASGTGFWIRYTLDAPLPGHGPAYAELWFARFDAADPANTFGVHKRWPIEALRTADSPFSVAIGDAEVRNDRMRGAFTGGGHDVAWDLSWRAAAEAHRFLPDFAYKTDLVIAKASAANQNVAASGEIVVDGRRYALDGDPLGQSHVWGRKKAYAWGWGHCNAFEGDRAASFEAFSARLKRGSVILPNLTFFTLFLDGEELSFRQFWKLPLTRSEYRTGLYRLLGANADTKIEASFTCRADDMILCEYVDPDGDPAFCHNSCCADLAVTVWKRSPLVGRWREHRKLVAHHTAHFEWLGRAGDALHVKKVHQLVT
jgi:Tocopherol cyclase